jgi:hypothetical protein
MEEECDAGSNQRFSVLATCFMLVFLLGLFFFHKSGGEMFLGSIG